MMIHMTVHSVICVLCEMKEVLVVMYPQVSIFDGFVYLDMVVYYHPCSVS